MQELPDLSQYICGDDEQADAHEMVAEEALTRRISHEVQQQEQMVAAEEQDVLDLAGCTGEEQEQEIMEEQEELAGCSTDEEEHEEDAMLVLSEQRERREADSRNGQVADAAAKVEDCAGNMEDWPGNMEDWPGWEMRVTASGQVVCCYQYVAISMLLSYQYAAISMLLLVCCYQYVSVLLLVCRCTATIVNVKAIGFTGVFCRPLDHHCVTAAPGPHISTARSHSFIRSDVPQRTCLPTVGRHQDIAAD